MDSEWIDSAYKAWDFCLGGESHGLKRSKSWPLVKLIGCPCCLKGKMTGRSRTGMTVSKANLADWSLNGGWAVVSEVYLMNASEKLEESATDASRLLRGYKEFLDQFRSCIKNDISSLEASARKTADAVAKMNRTYGDVIALMSGTDMRQAVENAERVAAAMAALANVQSHSLTLAVVDGQPCGNAS